MNRLTGLLTGVGLVAVLTACGTSETPLPTAPEQVEVTGAAPAVQACDNPLQSYAPRSDFPEVSSLDSPTVAEIRARGRLIAGVSADTYLLGSRNPITGQIEGFDIDVVKQIALAIFGDATKYQLRVITAAERLDVLKNNEVDIVARNMTMNCVRWEEIGFSAQYYLSGQKVLVSKGSDVTSLEGLAGHRVCAPNGTSSISNIRAQVPDAEVVPSDNHTGCLVLLQQGKVDAITGDDTVLAGLAAQDPYAVVLDIPAFTEEPYGIGVNAEHIDLAQFINGVLEQMRADGTWDASYKRWLQPTLGKSLGQPVPEYGRRP